MAKLMILFAILSTALITRYVSAGPTVSKQSVLASCFNWPTGNRGNRLDGGGYYYAELSKDFRRKDFKALNGLPDNYPLRITYGNKTITATKGSVGAGGRNNPKIDLHFKAAKALVPGIRSCSQFGIKSVIIESA